MIPIRDSQPSYTFPWVTIALISINLLVFLFQLTLSPQPSVLVDLAPWRDRGINFAGQEGLSAYDRVRLSPKRTFIYKYGLVPGEVANRADLPPPAPFPIYLTLITSTFLHGGFFHLIGNMLFLWIFGDNVEDAMGHFKFLVFYFSAGVGGALFQIMSNVHSGVPMIGASGAIAGVLAAYFLLFPRSRILTLVPIFFFITFVHIPAVIMLGLWFLFQLVRAPGAAVGGVAVLAHVGGFLTGALLTPYFKRRGVSIELTKYFR